MHSFQTFRYPLMIKEHHLDTFGHVNNATYLSLFEEARWEFLDEQGYTLDKIQSEQKGPVILGCEIKFLKELKARQSIVIETQLLGYQKKIGVMHQIMIDKDKTLYCDAKMTFGFFDMQARKLITPTPEWLRAIGAGTS